MHRRALSLRARLTLTMAGLALAVCATLAYFMFHAASDIIENDASRTVDAVAESQKTLLDRTLTAQFERLHATVENVKTCTTEECVRGFAQRLVAREEPDAVRVTKSGMRPVELGVWEGLEALPTPPSHVIAQPFRDRAGKQRYVMARTADGTTLSVVWTATHLDPLFARIPALGESGETFLTDSEGYFLTTPRYRSDTGHTKPITVPAMQRCLSGEDGTLTEVDYRGVPILHSYRHIEATGGGCILAEIDLDEAEAPVRKLEREILAASAASALVAIVLASYSSKRLTRVTVALGQYARRLRAGDLAAPIPTVKGTREQEALAATLASMAKELHEEQQVRERFIGILAHDLQNPLSAVLLSTALVQKTTPTEPTLRLTTTIVNNAKRLSRMVAELLDFARSRRPEGLPVHPTEVDIGALAASAVETIRGVHPSRTIDLVCEADLQAWCDSDRALQVVTNLLENALRYGADDRPVTVTLRGKEDEIELRVHNWGKPIDVDDLNMLFDAFRRGRGAAQRAGGGLGLGLYVVDQVMRAHGGRVEVTSSEADGTTFVTHWPRT